MSDWLVTFTKSLGKEKRDAILESAGAKVREGAEPIPLGSEIAVQVTADDAAASALRKAQDVIEVYPDSETTPYK